MRFRFPILDSQYGSMQFVHSAYGRAPARDKSSIPDDAGTLSRGWPRHSDPRRSLNLYMPSATQYGRVPL